MSEKNSTVGLLFALLAASVSASVAGCGGHSGGGNAGNPSPSVVSLSPASADAGSSALTLTVNGTQFVSAAVVSWNGVALPTTFVSASQLTASVPMSDLAFAGGASVSVTNPAPGGGSSATLPFNVAARIANGSALAGAMGSPALAATTDMPPIGVASTHVQDGVIMNRLDVRFGASATVGQVNDALANIGAGIVSMTHGFPALTVGIPEQASVADLDSLTDHLEASPGILIATLAEVPAPLELFTVAADAAPQDRADAAARIGHLLPGRFPAAWNLVDQSLFGDPRHPVADLCPLSTPVLVDDYFDATVPSAFVGTTPPLSLSDNPAAGIDAVTLQHGYDVTTVLAANAVGANPFPFSGCVDLQLVQSGLNLSWDQITDYLVAHMPASRRFVVNYSQGFRQQCAATGCRPPSDSIRSARFFAAKALHWKEATRSRWADFLIVAAAGNDRNKESTEIYPGLGDSRYSSDITISQLPDATFQFVAEDALWTPDAAQAALGFVSLKPNAPRQASLMQAVIDAGLQSAIADNVIVVGGAQPQSADLRTVRVAPDLLAESAFSDSRPDLLTIGEDVFGKRGTSFAAPQITGLISLLWMLSPELHNEPVTTTKRALLANARNKFVDAYATALSLDPAQIPSAHGSPMRLRLLDVTGLAGFDEADLDEFLRHLFVVDANGDITRQASPGTLVDASRFDLNGDGFTTAGARRERFDLDRVLSTQYGATSYLTITETIEGAEISFNENELTDLEILCYYAYSPMYTGDPDARKAALAGRCGAAVQPATASLSPGQTQQFTAQLPSNAHALWSATCGTIDTNGLYTAGNAGPCTVRATDANDPGVSGTATVSILGTFNAEVDYNATITGRDQSNGAEVFPREDADASNSSFPDPTLGPIDLSHSGTLNATNSTPTNYTITAHGDGPIAKPIAGTGTFTGSSGCSANGDTAMPDLRSDYGGSLTVSVPPGGLSFAFTGSMARTESRGTGGRMDLTGLVTVMYVDGGGAQQTEQFRLGESTGATIPFNTSRRLAAPASLTIEWRLTSECYLTSVGPAIDAARAGTITLSYSLSN